MSPRRDVHLARTAAATGENDAGSLSGGPMQPSTRRTNTYCIIPASLPQEQENPAKRWDAVGRRFQLGHGIWPALWPLLFDGLRTQDHPKVQLLRRHER